MERLLVFFVPSSEVEKGEWAEEGGKVMGSNRWLCLRFSPLFFPLFSRHSFLYRIALLFIAMLSAHLDPALVQCHAVFLLPSLVYERPTVQTLRDSTVHPDPGIHSLL